MKLRNKETGETGELHFEPNKEYHFMVATEDPADTMIFKTLARLTEEWEDYKEPKEFWYINIFGEVCKDTFDEYSQRDNNAKAIGNYFETKEEAEKVVEKLKALKRLKDKGFKFNKWTIPEEPKTTHIKLVLYAEMEAPDSPYDLHLLFGGEE